MSASQHHRERISLRSSEALLHGYRSRPSTREARVIPSHHDSEVARNRSSVHTRHSSASIRHTDSVTAVGGDHTYLAYPAGQEPRRKGLTASNYADVSRGTRNQRPLSSPPGAHPLPPGHATSASLTPTLSVTHQELSKQDREVENTRRTLASHAVASLAPPLPCADSTLVCPERVQLSSDFRERVTGFPHSLRRWPFHSSHALRHPLEGDASTACDARDDHQHSALSFRGGPLHSSHAFRDRLERDASTAHDARDDAVKSPQDRESSASRSP